MGDFDDVVEHQRPSSESTIRKKVETNDTPPVSLIDLISNEESLGGMAGKINPELRGKVLVPLANILDKYGMSDRIAASDTTQSTVGLLTLLNDIAPVIKGLTDYISGQRNALSEEDKLFLEQIRDAQESGEFSELFTSEEETDIPSEESEPPSRYHPLLGELPEINIDGKINWMDIVDPEGADARNNLSLANTTLNLNATPEEQEANVNFFNNDEKFLSSGMVSLEDLAKEAGVEMDSVIDSDTQIRGDVTNDSFSEEVDELRDIQNDVIDLLGGDLIDDIMESTMFEPDELEQEEVVYLTTEEMEDMEAEGFVLEEVVEESYFEAPRSYYDGAHRGREEENLPLEEEVIEINYEGMKVSQLREILKETGLKVSGNKNELIHRLREFDMSL